MCSIRSRSALISIRIRTILTIRLHIGHLSLLWIFLTRSVILGVVYLWSLVVIINLVAISSLTNSSSVRSFEVDLLHIILGKSISRGVVPCATGLLHIITSSMLSLNLKFSFLITLTSHYTMLLE